MTQTARRRLLIAVVVVLLAFAVGAVWLVRSQGAYYTQVGELREGLDGKTVKVGGTVVPGSIARAGDRVEFAIADLTGGSAQAQVVYSGAVPPAFAPGADVVVEGTYSMASRQIAATSLQTKCPSKYRASQSPSVPSTAAPLPTGSAEP